VGQGTAPRGPARARSGASLTGCASPRNDADVGVSRLPGRRAALAPMSLAIRSRLPGRRAAIARGPTRRWPQLRGRCAALAVAVPVSKAPGSPCEALLLVATMRTSRCRCDLAEVACRDFQGVAWPLHPAPCARTVVMPRLPGRREAVTRGPSCRHRLRFQGAEQPTTRWRSAPTARSPLPRRGAATAAQFSIIPASVSASKARSSPGRAARASVELCLRFQGAEQPSARTVARSTASSPLPRRGAALVVVAGAPGAGVSASKARSSPVTVAAGAV